MSVRSLQKLAMLRDAEGKWIVEFAFEVSVFEKGFETLDIVQTNQIDEPPESGVLGIEKLQHRLLSLNFSSVVCREMTLVLARLRPRDREEKGQDLIHNGLIHAKFFQDVDKLTV
jgi:hypothetical protein